MRSLSLFLSFFSHTSLIHSPSPSLFRSFSSSDLRENKYSRRHLNSCEPKIPKLGSCSSKLWRHRASLSLHFAKLVPPRKRAILINYVITFRYARAFSPSSLFTELPRYLFAHPLYARSRSLSCAISSFNSRPHSLDVADILHGSQTGPRKFLSFFPLSPSLFPRATSSRLKASVVIFPTSFFFFILTASAFTR